MKARVLILTLTSSIAVIAPAAHAARPGAQPARQLQNLVFGDGIYTSTPGRQPSAVKTHRVKVVSPIGRAPYQVRRNAI